MTTPDPPEPALCAGCRATTGEPNCAECRARLVADGEPCPDVGDADAAARVAALVALGDSRTPRGAA